MGLVGVALPVSLRLSHCAVHCSLGRERGVGGELAFAVGGWWFEHSPSEAVDDIFLSH